jgi:hypothetical protein
MNAVRTPVTDKNGKLTHVWKNPEQANTAQAGTTAVPSAAVAHRYDYEYAMDMLTDGEFSEAPHLIPVFESLVEQYGDPWCGRTRATFDRGDGFVIKFPLDEEGALATSNESAWSSDFIPLAKCEMEFIDDVPVLVMEKVEMVTVDYNEMPTWVGFVDCGQVGRNADGELVAYDL